MENKGKNLKNGETKNVFNLLNIQIILVIFGLFGILLISGCVNEKPAVPAEPANCSAVNNDFSGCDISCDADSDCKTSCCGCVNENENCRTESNGGNVSCELAARNCKCMDKKCTLKPPVNPDDIGNASYIVEAGPVDEKTVSGLAGEYKVAFFFLHNPGCSHCSAAEQNLPEIRQMFGQRMIIYKLKVREPESLPWSNTAIGAGLSSYPFTLAVGARSFDGGIINKSRIGMTSSSGAEKYEE